MQAYSYDRPAAPLLSLRYFSDSFSIYYFRVVSSPALCYQNSAFELFALLIPSLSLRDTCYQVFPSLGLPLDFTQLLAPLPLFDTLPQESLDFFSD